MGSEAKVLELLRERYGVDVATVSPDTRLMDLGLDSIAMALLIADVEEVFEIRIDFTAARIETLGDTVALVDRLRFAK